MMNKYRGVAALVLPVLVLGGAGVLLQSLQGGQPSPEVSGTRFGITVNRIEFLRTGGYRSQSDKGRAPKAGEEVITAFVFVDYVGRAPSWWMDEKRGRPRMAVRDVVITNPNGDVYKPRYFPSGTSTDGTRRYQILVDCTVPRVRPASAIGTFTATAHVEGAGRVRFSVPITITHHTRYNPFNANTTPGVKIIKL